MALLMVKRFIGGRGLPLCPITCPDRNLFKKYLEAEEPGKISTILTTVDSPPPFIRVQRVGRPLISKKEALLVKYSTGSSAPKIFFGSMHHTLTCWLRHR